ncbi:MAG: hypothetical protein DUD39_01905 [Coriobacteriaceae bacterium]|nr:MAG: hypothetical protein DUD39_01905 [Coriobacteriaceae bacterium]
MSCTDTRDREERDVLVGQARLQGNEGNALFGNELAMQKGDSLKHYEDLISQNELPCACDIADEMLFEAYLCTQEQDMCAAMERIVEVCRETGDRHFARVARLAEGHRGGIVAPARRHISSGRVEGTNCMIETLRRAG